MNGISYNFAQVVKIATGKMTAGMPAPANNKILMMIESFIGYVILEIVVTLLLNGRAPN